MSDILAKVIAAGLGYDWDTLYENKTEWTADQGSRHDINVPYKANFREAAKGAAGHCAGIAKGYAEEQAILEARTDDSKLAHRIFNRAQAGFEIERRLRAPSNTEESGI